MDEFEYYGMEQDMIQAEAVEAEAYHYAQMEAEAAFDQEQQQRDYERQQAETILEGIENEIEALQERISDLRERKQDILSSIKN